MLGTLPSSYLKWVSKTLRARHFEDWAKLADQVLQDPLYQDRLEWEFAQNALDGNRTSSSSSGVADLLEISQRFGWDNEDKLGWSRVDFELLGTSKSGRIPRVDGGKSGGKGGGKRGGKVEDEREGGGSGSGRSERRERVKLRMRREIREEKLGIVEKGRGSLGKESVDSGNEVGLRKEIEMGVVYNPFPGRQPFLKNVLEHKLLLF